MKFSFFQKYFGQSHEIHLDFAATTPVHPDVLSVMKPYWNTVSANPSALYRVGRQAREVIEHARMTMAELLRIRSHGVIFTSGGTESNNLALIGYVEDLHLHGRAYDDIEIITTEIEHPSIIETCRILQLRGVHVRYVDVDAHGHILIQAFEKALSTRTALVSFGYVNSEVGVVQDVKRLTRIVRAYNKSHGTHILVHLDGAQAPLWLPCEMDMLGIDILSLDAGKCYGPKGIGVLALRHGIRVAPILFGGGQEGGVRSGTENTPLIVGCVHALERAMQKWEERSEKVISLRNHMFALIKKEIPTACINGDTKDRVANNVNISIPGIDGEYAVITLDVHHINASTKSACGGAKGNGSSVVRVLTQDAERALGTIRFTLGEETTRAEVAHAVRVLRDHVRKMETFTTSLDNAHHG